jgi:hypothetical protein
MKPRERRTYWRQVTRIQLKLQAKYSARIKAVLDRKLKEFIESYKDKGSLDMLELWNDELLDVYKKMYQETFVTFANVQYRRLREISKQYEKNMGFNAEWTQQVNEWLARYGLNLVSTVSGNFREVILDLINKQIQDGVEQGLGVDVVTNNILRSIREFGDRSSYWAERIARTETMRASNLGHMAGARKHKFVVVKEWISAKDTRTRRYEKNVFDHWVLDGQQREMDEAFFQVGRNGQAASAQQPGDADAPKEFTINCRCTIAFEPKRDNNGRLIRK